MLSGCIGNSYANTFLDVNKCCASWTIHTLILSLISLERIVNESKTNLQN